MATDIDQTERWLSDHRIAFRLVPHAAARTIEQEARASRIPLEQTVQAQLLRDGERSYLAVLPACERLDLAKARRALGASAGLQMEGEWTGAPPFGGSGSPRQVVDRRLLTYNKVLCSAGDPSHSVLVDGDAIVRATGAIVADISAPRG